MDDLTKDIENNPTIFGKILRGEIPANKVYEDDTIFAFHDIAPRAKIHVLVIPKKYIPSMEHLSGEDTEMLSHLLSKIPHIAEKVGVKDSGFRLITNSGVDSGQEVPHLHFHLLGGERLGSLIGDNV